MMMMMFSMMTIVQLFILQSIFLFSSFFCLETDTISPGLSIRDPDTIVSNRHLFRLGFFTPGNTTHRYLAVFYNFSETTVVWVANRDKPLVNDSSGVVKIADDGNLVLLNSKNQTVWSTNAAAATTTTAQITDSGNLVLRDNATGATIWDSFSHPSNVYLPTMKISKNINTGEKVVLSSWRNDRSDPRLGSFTSGIKVLNIPQIFIWKNGRPHWRSGPWNGRIFMGIKEMYSLYLNTASIKNDSDGTFYFTVPDRWRLLSMVVLNSSGTLVQTFYNDQKMSWDVAAMNPSTVCDVYNTCGAFGICHSQSSPVCSCLKGFEPTNMAEWGRGNWTSGCRRINLLQCTHRNNDTGGKSGDGFLRLKFVNVPDFAQQYYSATRKEECRARCSMNCSCIAYAHDPNIGCMFWSNTTSLIDIQKFNRIGVDLYLRLSASDFEDKKLFIIISVVVVVVVVFIIFIAWYWMVKAKGKKINVKKKNDEAGLITYSSDSTEMALKDESRIVNLKDLLLFNFEMLSNATDQFHDKNLLGKGGFGPVYKGNLADGNHEIAVKRLSAASGQGVKEFMNEVIVICKLQHRNLVRLLGCCVDKAEKMLIYEYLPNKSLDIYLFDTSSSQNVLDWKKRFNIIEGIGRGLLYLHRDSRLRIIHRDLKPSNVLLDENWNPKISDFGMARIFGGDQDHGNTSRVVGTYGYMAPEYAMEGRFSEKSDVYSFGVLMLEIVKGEKNTHYYNQELSLSLLGCAWKLWSEDSGLAFADKSIAIPEFKEEIIRCIHIALLCVQEFPKDRPSIQTVLSMLSREILELPPPEQPVFAEKWARSTQPSTEVGFSVNELTVTALDGR